MDTESVSLTGFDSPEISVVHVGRVLGNLDLLLGALFVEQAEVNRFSGLGVDGNVDPGTIPDDTERLTVAEKGRVGLVHPRRIRR